MESPFARRSVTQLITAFNAISESTLVSLDVWLIALINSFLFIVVPLFLVLFRGLKNIGISIGGGSSTRSEATRMGASHADLRAATGGTRPTTRRTSRGRRRPFVTNAHGLHLRHPRPRDEVAERIAEERKKGELRRDAGASGGSGDEETRSAPAGRDRPAPPARLALSTGRLRAAQGHVHEGASPAAPAEGKAVVPRFFTAHGRRRCASRRPGACRGTDARAAPRTPWSRSSSTSCLEDTLAGRASARPEDPRRGGLAWLDRGAGGGSSRASAEGAGGERTASRRRRPGGEARAGDGAGSSVSPCSATSWPRDARRAGSASRTSSTRGTRSWRSGRAARGPGEDRARPRRRGGVTRDDHSPRRPRLPGRPRRERRKRRLRSRARERRGGRGDGQLDRDEAHAGSRQESMGSPANEAGHAANEGRSTTSASRARSRWAPTR